MEHLFDTRPPRPGYRLHRLEAFNWGTFDSLNGHVYRFEPNGRTALLVGHNGAGKSTLVDAILTLLVDSRTRNYNVAAGAKKMERTAKSYIRGAFDRTADATQSSVVKYLRPQGTHLTAISAVFRDEQLDRAFTLFQVLYLRADGSDNKVFAIADEARELTDDLVGLRKSDEIRDHLKHLGYQTTKTFVEYQGWLTKRTQMRSKAMAMFNQTVAVKDIYSLTDFIRSHMLEAHDWRDKVQRLLTHFNDLSVAHQELVRARKAEELLTPVERLGTKYRQRAEELCGLERQLDAGATFFSIQLIALFDPEIAEHESKLAAMVATIERLDDDLKQAQEMIRQLKNEIDLTGGDRLKRIPDLIGAEKSKLELKRTTFTRFHDQLKTCRIEGIVSNADLFRQTRERLRTVARSSEEKIATLSAQHDDTVGKRAALQRQLSEERNELEILQQRRTNLPSRCSAMRARLCEDLALDESVLPFAAELIAVLPDERRWETSIEMVLRPFALSLLVPDRFYRRVRAYVETNRILDARGDGQKLDYICVGKSPEVAGDRVHAQSLLRKLQFKPRHDLVPWVRGEIQRRFDFRCCESVDEFNDVPRLAMTVNRHVKFGPERHQKDDRPHVVDPRHFVLGWDNAEKKRRIAEGIRELEAELAKLDDAIVGHKRRLDEMSGMKRAALAALEVTDFDSINVNRHKREIAALEEEKKQLEESNEAVRALRERLAQAGQRETKISGARDDLLQQKGKLEDEIDRVKRMVDTARAEVQTAKDAGQFKHHEIMFDAIADSLGEPPLSTMDLFPRRKDWERSTDQRIKWLREPLQELGDKLVNAMSKYLREFKEEQDDLDASVNSLDSFLGLLDQLRREDLPRHERKFKERLNDQVSQEVAVFNTDLRLERKHIEDKIDLLNEALAELEYHPGTYMRLEPRRVQDREIEDFRRSLRECLDESLEQTEAANEARFLRIQKLVERLGDKERTSWRNKVIDVRNWYDFAAREVERNSGETRSYYDGSSGQSGGEKAKLAFTILVAAIAYQYDIDPTGTTPGRFQFVVVDEMFSKVDDQNAKYALQLFEQFGLQLLIVAPLDAKARVTEPFVDSYLHVVKDDATNRSQLYSMTAREYEEVVKSFAGNGKSTKPRRAAAK